VIIHGPIVKKCENVRNVCFIWVIYRNLPSSKHTCTLSNIRFMSYAAVDTRAVTESAYNAAARLVFDLRHRDHVSSGGSGVFILGVTGVATL